MYDPSRGPSMVSLLRLMAREVADRARLAGPLARAAKKIFPDHWSFFLGELALYSFIILILTGTYLALFFKPSMAEVVYHGAYTKLDGITMSEAYDSTLRISFDVRGGLLIRQIHHWAALIFVASISIHMIRIFVTGAFRRPREFNWLVGVTLFALAAAEGFLGYSLPDDDLSGTGLRIAASIILSIPVIGTYLMIFLFGGVFPGEAWVGRFYILHVFVVPALLAALIGAHLLMIWHQGHTQWPGKRQREDNEVGDRMYPYFMAKTGALFFFVFGVIALLSTFAQINPIWFYGPYNPAVDQAGSQPDWYIGFVEGSLRLMPGVVSNLGGHTFVWNVFIPAVLLPAGFFLLAGIYPLFEEYVTVDLRHHQILDRPRNAPNRTAFGAGVIAMGLVIQLAGGDDVISWKLNIPLYAFIWFLRAGFFVFPVLAFMVTRHICLSLQRADRRKLSAGTTYGVTRSLPDGAYAPVSKPVSEEERAILEAHRPDELVAPIPKHLIPLPTPGRVGAQVRARLNRFYTLTRLETRYGVGRIEAAMAQRLGNGRGPSAGRRAESGQAAAGEPDGQRPPGSEDDGTA